MEIKSRFDHFNINVTDLERSIAFYEKALGLKEHRRKEAKDGSFILVYLTDSTTGFLLELTWLRDHTQPYELEGINNKIKTMKRQAYGYRDQKFFELKILAMHEKNYAFIG